MARNKFENPLMPGQLAANKQERENRKAKARAKKARKQGIVSFDIETTEQVTVSYDPAFGSDATVIYGKLEEQYLNDWTPAMEEQAKNRTKREPSTESPKLDRFKFGDGDTSRMRIIPLSPTGRTYPMQRPPRNEAAVEREMGYMIDLLGKVMGISLKDERTFEELEQEFAGLMENHERLMNHFR